MLITLKSTYFSDGSLLSADNVVFAWKRILDVENSSEAAVLLYDIKNARAIKEGDMSIDDLGVAAVDTLVLEITFADVNVDRDQFILTLTSPCLVPLPGILVPRTDDWAKKPGTIACSGPFMLRTANYADGFETLVLERNSYYFRDRTKDALDKSVKPYRLVIDYTKTDEEIKQAYDNGEIFYIGDIPLSIRNYYKDTAKITDAMSTHAYYFNTAKAPFDNLNVRLALSATIDREAIAQEIVFAEAASALVPFGIFDSTSPNKSFREVGGVIISTKSDLTKANQYIAESGINPSDYTFTLSVAAYDEVHVKIGEMVVENWKALGFNVSLNPIDVIVNDDIGPTGDVSTDIRDDIYMENLFAGEFDVIGLDIVATSVNALSILAPFAKQFSGQSVNMDVDINNPVYELTPHITKFDNEEYNAKIEEAFGKNGADRAAVLHEAENMLLEQMPVIPIIFNKNATLTSDELSKITTSYYGFDSFKKTILKDYKKYLEENPQ
jgi:ABC-type oligopeptide transport system substrate-binding subunit